jgi:precorrin-6A/cobalt-precorrin-6A reductase
VFPVTGFDASSYPTTARFDPGATLSSTARLLLLGGTSEAGRLSRVLADRRGLTVVTSLAGRTNRPAAAPGERRIGGFGGTAGLAAYLREERISAVVDATHPFAAVMRWHALDACNSTEVPRLRLERPSWAPRPDDRWTVVPTMTDAAAATAAHQAHRVFLTIGRTGLEAFLPAADGRRWWLIRSIDPPRSLELHPAEIVLDRGPFTVDAETDLMLRHGVDLVVTKNSGGDATAAKLAAARHLGIEVLMVSRPPSPPGPSATTPDEAARWVIETLGLPDG